MNQQPDDLTMFRIEETPDGGAVLTLHSQDSDGQIWSATYRLDLRLACAFRAAVVRDLVTAGTPEAQEAAAAEARAGLAATLDAARAVNAASASY